jgi:hypothetical protein
MHILGGAVPISAALGLSDGCWSPRLVPQTFATWTITGVGGPTPLPARRATRANAEFNNAVALTATALLTVQNGGM